MASYRNGWEGYEQIHCPHMCYHEIHELSECDPLIRSHTGKLCWLLSYCLKRECHMEVPRQSTLLEAGHLLSPTPLLHVLQLLWPLKRTYNFPYSTVYLDPFMTQSYFL